MHDASRDLDRLLADAPDPVQATTLARRVLNAARLPALAGDRLKPVLTALCGVAPFFGHHLLRNPDWLGALLADDLSAPREAAAVDARIARELERHPAPVALRRAKYFELARITVRDCSPEWVPVEHSAVTLAELSRLADRLLDRALGAAQDELTRRIGPPRWKTRDAVEAPLGFCVLGLGKLGSEELNYSSDVDLVYVYESPPGDLDPASGVSPGEYFSRLARAFGTLVSDNSVEGFLYRIDLELRPEGAQGPLVVSDEALSSYFESRAAMWEKAAFMKARPVAGDLELGWRSIRAIDPILYRSSMDYSAVEAIRELKTRIEEAHGERNLGFNVKVDSGGIRDVEFIAQSLQLLHGGRIPQLRIHGTQAALENLAVVGILSEDRVSRLLDAYRFLRRVENRLQMEDERQTHRLPTDPAARQRLARSLGWRTGDSVAKLDRAMTERRECIRSIFDEFFFDRGSERVNELFARNVPTLLANPLIRRNIERLAESFAREIDSSIDSERALNNLDRFISGIGSRRFYFELLIDRPELVPRLASVFAESSFLSTVLASHPRLVEPLFHDPDVLVIGKPELRMDLEAIRAELEDSEQDPVEVHLNALRLFFHRHILNVGLLDVGDEIDRRTVETALTEIAEVCLEGGLALARRQMVGRAEPSGRFLVVAMGKLASREMSYGSDLDLIFLFDTLDRDVAVVAEAQHHYARLAQRLIAALQTSTREGACYEVDARLRPSGNQGTLVTSLPALRTYHETSAAPWERQILLRARPVVGDDSLVAEFETLRREILRRPLAEDPRPELHRIRLRMERELARETPSRHHSKLGRGGLLDVESVVQYLQLVHGPRHDSLLDVERIEVLLERLTDLACLDTPVAEQLANGWSFLQRLGSRLRIVENRSISDLNLERGDLEGLARRMGYAGAGARRSLLADYRRHTESIRRIYDQIFVPSESQNAN